jgi:hypothetical protein
MVGHRDGMNDAEARRQTYEAQWEIVHAERWRAARARRAAAGKSHVVGKFSGRLLLWLLKMAASVTRDQRFVEAIEAAKFWGFANKPHHQLLAAHTERCLAEIDRLYLYGNDGNVGPSPFTITEACQYFVAEHGLGSPDTTFEKEVERLRRAWFQSGRSAS